MIRVGAALAALFLTAAFTVLESPGQGFDSVPLRPSIKPADPGPEVRLAEQPAPAKPAVVEERRSVRIVLPSPYSR
jgi:hypothetical protein